MILFLHFHRKKKSLQSFRGSTRISQGWRENKIHGNNGRRSKDMWYIFPGVSYLRQTYFKQRVEWGRGDVWGGGGEVGQIHIRWRAYTRLLLMHQRGINSQTGGRTDPSWTSEVDISWGTTWRWQTWEPIGWPARPASGPGSWGWRGNMWIQYLVVKDARRRVCGQRRKSFRQSITSMCDLFVKYAGLDKVLVILR